ncbi:MAG TPA: NHL repeat-containing protein [Solirubrobacterales bacterium]|nr:NHL repeat-containing protein [Solirubrobacterales bacterium]
MLGVQLSPAWGDSAAGPEAVDVDLGAVLSGPEPALTDPEAASELPHADLDRQQVLNLLEGVFEPVLQAPAGPYDDLEVEDLIGTHAAVVDGDHLPEPTGVEVGSPRQPPSSAKYLIDSTLPLKSEGEVVDLGLEDVGGALESANPVVSVRIPGELGDGISLPDLGVEVDLLGSPEERTPSLIDSTAVYPNVAPDTDFIVAPTPSGFETFTSFRSPDAPRTQEIGLNLPSGAEMQPVEGGAAVFSDGEKRLQISKPVALDAAGVDVPVDMSIEGATITLEIHPGPSTQYPVLADPAFLQNFSFGQVPAGWESYSTDRTWMVARCCDQSSGQVASGMAARAMGATYSPESDDHWSYFVPRYWQDAQEGHSPTSFIEGFYLTQVNTQSSTGPSSPYPYAGVYDPALNDWGGLPPYKALWAREGNLSRLIAGTVTFTPGGDKQAQEAVGPGIHTNEYASIGGPREMVVGSAMVTLGDEDLPGVILGSGVEVWANQTPKVPLEATVTDTGLGARSATFRLPGQAPVKITNPCAGTAALPCPSSWRAVAATSTYNTSVMPQGWLSVPVDGEDVVGQKSATPAIVEVGIDHTAPAMSAISGSLTEQGTIGTHRLEYGLKFSATDGFESPAALQKTITSSFSHPVGIAVDNSGSVWVVDRDHNQIKKFNQAGEAIGSFGTTGSGNGQLLEPRMIAVDASGNLWVTDMGNHRIQEFTSSGTYIRQLKDPTLDNPYGIVVDQKGAIWVSDLYRNEVVKLTLSGGALSIAQRVKGEKTSTTDTTFVWPSGMAVDSAGNIWVADKGHDRLQEISPSGAIIRQVGQRGSAPGQLREPYGVAVTGLGHLLVTDGLNHRVQLLDAQGDFLRMVGSGPAAYGLPTELAVGPNNAAFVVDSEGNKVQKWGNVDLDSQSGVVKSEVLVDGVLRETYKPSCTGQTVCALDPHEWILKAREFAEGQHSAQVVVTDSVGLTTSSPEITFDLHPDRTSPQLTLSGSMTQQATLGSTLPSYKLRIDASDPEPKESSFVYASSVSSANSKSLLSPADAAVDAKGNVWVADKGNNRVVEFNAAGAFVREVASFGTNGGKLSAPSGVVVDPGGKIWVADTANNRVVELNETGGFLLAIGRDVNKTKADAAGTEAERNFCTAASGNLCQAGLAGSTGTQLKAPQGIASTTGGNIWVADTGNSRLKKYNPTNGSLFNNIGGEGSAAGQVKEPTSIAVASDNSFWVADTGNNRIEYFSSAPAFVRQVGSEGTGSSQFKRPTAIDIDPAGNPWVGDLENQRVKVFDQTGQFLTSYKNLQPTGDTQPFSPAGIARGPEGHVYVVDSKNNRVQHWVPGSLSQSGVVSSTIKVDGKAVDSYNPGCATETCTLAREWTLNSTSYAAGAHTVEATVSDGSGLTSSKSLSINIQRDTTAPTISSTGPLAEAPEGWVEQKTYSFTATSTDPNGFGVKQIRLLIDGSLVGESTATSCEAGGCSKGKTFNVNAANYKGGAHEIAVIAEDGAGNWKKQSWTMNVDPQGPVTADEATDTLEAMEETVPPEEEFMPVASTEEFLEPEVIEAGDNPHFHWEEGSIVSSGVTVDTTFDPASDLLTIEGTEGPLEITPTASTSQPAISESASAVVPSTGGGTDTVIRPEYNGAFMFTTIREASAPEEYAWHVHLNNGQYLLQASPSEIEVFSKTGARAFLITATPARDATGKAVATSLAILGNSDIALTVHHKTGGFVYPVTAGQSYETGYAVVTAIFTTEEEREANEEAAEPLTPVEEAELNAEVSEGLLQSSGPYAFSSTSHQRDRNKPISSKKAKRIMRPKRSGREVPAPGASASGGPGSCCGEPYNPIETNGRIASSFNDDIWDVEIQDGYFYKFKDWVQVGWNREAEPKCDDDVLWYWKLNLLISNQSTPGNVGPALARRGSGDHLTYRCLYTILMGPLPEEYVMEEGSEMQLRVYPNGYQASFTGEVDWNLLNKTW